MRAIPPKKHFFAGFKVSINNHTYTAARRPFNAPLTYTYYINILIPIYTRPNAAIEIQFSLFLDKQQSAINKVFWACVKLDEEEKVIRSFFCCCLIINMILFIIFNLLVFLFLYFFLALLNFYSFYLQYNNFSLLFVYNLLSLLICCCCFCLKLI